MWTLVLGGQRFFVESLEIPNISLFRGPQAPAGKDSEGHKVLSPNHLSVFQDCLFVQQFNILDGDFLL